MTQIIIGAGIAGLLAARMLRHHDPVIFELKDKLPNNHTAVLRFSSTVVADVLGIPFKRVNLVKSVLRWKNEVADSLAYSRKVLGIYASDRSPVLPARNTSTERWIAPPDLISRMAEGLEIKYESGYDTAAIKSKVISTVPMPILMRILHYPLRESIEFPYTDGFNIRAHVSDCDAYVSLIVPDPDMVFSRVSLSGSELIVECPNQPPQAYEQSAAQLVTMAAGLIGIDKRDLSLITFHRQAYSKIAPINETERKRFIFWASSIERRAFSLGRFATWRPGLLTDDLVNDIRLIDSWVKNPMSAYYQDIHFAEQMR
jgi:hypothetical protein